MASTIIPPSPPSKNDSEQRDRLHSAHKAVKAVNALFFLGFALITFREVYLCFEKYVSFPKYTTLKFVSQREVDFPSISFCPNIMSRFKENALQVYIKSLLYHDSLRFINKFFLKISWLILAQFSVYFRSME